MAKFKISDVVDVYFNLKGRIGRGDFWAYGVPLSLVLYLSMALLTLAPSPWGALLSLVIYALFIWAYMGLLVKRGHDRGRPAALSIVVLAARVILALVGGYFGPLAVALQIALILYVFVDYAVLPGKPGANRYGPSPSGLGHKTPLVLGTEAPAEGAALSASSPKA